MEPRVYFLGFGTGRRGGWTWVAAVTAVWEASQEGGTRLKRYSGLAGKDVEARHAWRRDTNASAPEGTGADPAGWHHLRTVQRPALSGQLPGGQIRADPHLFVAVRTPVSGGGGDVWGRWLSWWGRGEQLSCESQSGRAVRICQIPELPDADETARQDVLGETADELVGRKRHLPLLVAMSVVLPAEGHALAIEG